MHTNQKDKGNQKNEGMSNDETNQDFNKVKPNPNNPNQTKEHHIGEDDKDIEKREEETPKMDISATNNSDQQNQSNNKNDKKENSGLDIENPDTEIVDEEQEKRNAPARQDQIDKNQDSTKIIH